MNLSKFIGKKLGIGRSAFSVEGRGYWPVLFIYATGKRGEEQIARVEPHFKDTSHVVGDLTEGVALERALRYENPRVSKDGELYVDYRSDEGVTSYSVLALDPHATQVD